MWVEQRAEAQQRRDQAAAAGQDTTDLDELHRANWTGRSPAPGCAARCPPTRAAAPLHPAPPGHPGPAPPQGHPADGRQDLHRPGRQDVPPVDVHHPDLSELWAGQQDGTPADPAAYDYERAARDALAFAALFDRFIQNLRRFLGYDVQYFAAVEPQRRLAPHVHIAMRGTVSRAELRRVLAATYHQVWWPTPPGQVRRRGRAAVWDEATGNYLDPATGEVLPTWDQALDAIGAEDEPWHVARFGDRFDAQGVLSGSKDAGRCIGYLTKYLTKQVADCHQAQTDAQHAHAGRLAEALRYQPCSPRCANWLRYGIQPKNARPGLVPGRCKGKAHDADHLGYAGRRVLVSRKWSGKTLADHRADRKDGCCRRSVFRQPTRPGTPGNPSRPADPDHMEHARRLLHVVADRAPMAGRTRRGQTQGRYARRPPIFRQPGGRHDGGAAMPRAAADRGGSRRAA